jgi:hypothetical protein
VKRSAGKPAQVSSPRAPSTGHHDADAARNTATPSAWLRYLWASGAAALALAAAAFGVLEVHYSTDTWIGLAAGRQILSSPTFPIADTFSFSVAGRPWINQNWLSHAGLWWLYDRVGPDATVAATWAIGLAIFALVGALTRLRDGSPVAALLAAALAAFVLRDHLKIRPATVQLLLLASLVIALTALTRPAGRWRAWAFVLLAAVLGVWPHAHGSFLFGYGLVGTCVVTWAGAALATWATRRRAPAGTWRAPAITPALLGLLLGIVALSVLGAVLLSPFGSENLTHPFKVVESDVFREVGEWRSPLVPGKLPPVARFWVVAAVAVAAPLGIWLLRGLARTISARADAKSPAAIGSSNLDLHPVLFDAVLALLGIGMALFARRFVPFFCILTLPVLLGLANRLAPPLPDRWRARGGVFVGGVAWAAAIVLGIWTGQQTYADLIAPFENRSPAARASAPGADDAGPDAARVAAAAPNLLARVTRDRATPHTLLRFLEENAVPARLLTDWKLGGPAMFAAPHSRVFVDGRAQQVYDEAQLTQYLALLRGREPRAVADAAIATGADTLLLNGWETLKTLRDAVRQDPRWLEVLALPEGRLLVRRDAALLSTLLDRERAGTLRWPARPEAGVARGNLWAAQLGDPLRAVECWQAAVAGQPALGLDCYRPIVAALRNAGRPGEADAYVTQEQARIGTDPQLAPELRTRLLALLQAAAR